MLKTVLLDYNPIVSLTSHLLSKVKFVGQTADYLRSLLFNKDDPVLQKLLFMVGVTALTLHTTCMISRTIKKWGWIPCHILDNNKLSKQKLKQTYGDCFVFITGFTQGIGFAYAEIFAQFGFNLLLASRDNQKVEQKTLELKERYKDIRIESFAIDLANKKQIGQLQGFFKMFADLDIGIVINNAGSVTGGMFPTIDPQQLVNDVNCDLEAVFNINRLLIPRLRARHQRSAIINISSSTGYYLTGRVGVYSSAKLMLDVYSRILHLQNKDRIDVISLRPFGVTTKMMKMKKGPFMVNPRTYVKQSLAEMLAGYDVSFGHARHKFMDSLAFHGKSQEQTFRIFDGLWDAAKLKNQ